MCLRGRGRGGVHGSSKVESFSANDNGYDRCRLNPGLLVHKSSGGEATDLLYQGTHVQPHMV